MVKVPQESQTRQEITSLSSIKRNIDYFSLKAPEQKHPHATAHTISPCTNHTSYLLQNPVRKGSPCRYHPRLRMKSLKRERGSFEERSYRERTWTGHERLDEHSHGQQNEMTKLVSTER